MRIPAFIVAVTSALAVLACDWPVQARRGSAADSVPHSASHVDSILPEGEAVRRFQSELPRVTTLSHGARSRDELVARFISAVEAADTATLGSLLVSKSEYAFLYFPSSVYSRKPYELPPDVAWLLAEQNNRKGATRLVRRLGGTKAALHRYECSGRFSEGDNRFWRTCHVSFTDPTRRAVVERQLFGAIMERGGTYKFLSYANDF